MDELEKNQNTPDSTNEPEAANKPVEENDTPLGKLFSAWSSASEETVETIVSEKKEEAVEKTEEKVEEVKTEATEKVEEVKAAIPVATPEPEKKPMDKKKVGIFAGIGAAALILIIVLIVIFTGKSTLTISDYVTLDYEGVNGYAKAKLVIDYDKIEEDYGKKIKVSVKGSGNKELDSLLGAFSSLMTLSDVIQTSVDTTVTPNNGLKNGDEVKVTFNVNEEYFGKMTNGKIAAKDLTFTVENLENAKEFNPFDAMILKFEGFSGEGRLTIDTDVDAVKVQGLNYNVDKYYDLSNGDIIKFTIRGYYDDINEYCLRYGYIPTETEKTYKITELKEYEEVNLFDKLDVSFSGISGFGVINLNCDGLDVENVRFEADKTENLKNGDVVVVTAQSENGWYSLADILKEQGYKTSVETKEFKVSGLEELDAYDPFSDVEISYEGVSGYGNVVVTPGDKKETQYFNFNVRDNWNIANDGEVEIEVSLATDIDEFMDKFGQIPNLDTKKIKVEGMPHYFADGDQIDNDTLKAMISQSEDAIYGKAKDWWSVKLDKLTYVGDIEFIEKNFDNGRSYNVMILVFKMDCSFKSNSKDKFTSYTYMEFYDVTVDPEGKCDVDLYDYFNALDNKYYEYEHTAKDEDDNEHDTWTLDGYETIDDLKDEVINYFRERYFYAENSSKPVEDKSEETKPEEEETTTEEAEDDDESEDEEDEEE